MCVFLYIIILTLYVPDFICSPKDSQLQKRLRKKLSLAPPQELILSLQHRANSLGQADVVFLA